MRSIGSRGRVARRIGSTLLLYVVLLLGALAAMWVFHNWLPGTLMFVGGPVLLVIVLLRMVREEIAPKAVAKRVLAGLLVLVFVGLVSYWCLILLVNVGERLGLGL
jgi:CBS domain containing-hemolysin-like protein